MDLKEKVTSVTDDLLSAAIEAPVMGEADNIDEEMGEVVENPDGSAMRSFKMTQCVSDPPKPGRRGPGGGRPLGEVQYTVTVIARWVPYEDG